MVATEVSTHKLVRLLLEMLTMTINQIYPHRRRGKGDL
jgi:hypothetical protein